MRLQTDTVAKPIETGVGLAKLTRRKVRRLKVLYDDCLGGRVFLVPLLARAHLAVVGSAERLSAILDVLDVG